MATTVKYVGPLPEITFPSLGLSVERLGTIEVEADVAASLLERDDFERPKPARKAAAKKATAKKDVEPVAEAEPEGDETPPEGD